MSAGWDGERSWRKEGFPNQWSLPPSRLPIFQAGPLYQSFHKSPIPSNLEMGRFETAGTNPFDWKHIRHHIMRSS